MSIACSYGPDASQQASHGRQAAKDRARVVDGYFVEQSELKTVATFFVDDF